VEQELKLNRYLFNVHADNVGINYFYIEAFEELMDFGAISC